MLAGEDGIEVIGDCRLDGETLDVVERLRPDVVLMTLGWRDQDPMAICREIRERVPSTRVLVMSPNDLEEELFTSVLAGASGYVSHEADGPELARAIRIAFNGGGYFDRDAAQRLIGRLSVGGEDNQDTSASEVLSDRELRILKLFGLGYKNRRIGEELDLATSTVKNNITRIRGKLGLQSRTEMALYAERRGLLEERDPDQAGETGDTQDVPPPC